MIGPGLSDKGVARAIAKLSPNFETIEGASDLAIEFASADVALAAFGTAALSGWCRWQDRPCAGAAFLCGILAGLALGVKYPALFAFVAFLFAVPAVTALAA